MHVALGSVQRLSFLSFCTLFAQRSSFYYFSFLFPLLFFFHSSLRPTPFHLHHTLSFRHTDTFGMATINPPLCVASNSDSVFLITLETSSSRPPVVMVYQSQKNPTSLASIQWTGSDSYFINGPVSGVLPLDNSGSWCAADDSGAFVIIAGAKNTNSWSTSPFTAGHIRGLLHVPPTPSSPNTGGTGGGPSAGVGFSNVITTGYYPCNADSGLCSGYMFALPSATAGGPSNFV
ncbi:MAG: hypothetical protein JOS17DRAFT_845448 [Linnemannia elongata]|nr:MAG: hypothetical protein JOS17DRAFT_845448 [Linnemannia elongata]